MNSKWKFLLAFILFRFYTQYMCEKPLLELGLSLGLIDVILCYFSSNIVYVYWKVFIDSNQVKN